MSHSSFALDGYRNRTSLILKQRIVQIFDGILWIGRRIRTHDPDLEPLQTAREHSVTVQENQKRVITPLLCLYSVHGWKFRITQDCLRTGTAISEVSVCSLDNRNSITGNTGTFYQRNNAHIRSGTCPHRPWKSPSLVSTDYRAKSGRSLKLTIHIYSRFWGWMMLCLHSTYTPCLRVSQT
jgi:hypothetical protein